MKKVIAALLALAFSATLAWSAEKPLGVEELTSVNELAAAISSYFPKIQGDVKSVQHDTVTISIGSKEGLKSGVVLSLWRPGKEVLHPTTGAVLGRTEEEVGNAEVVEVSENSSTLRVIKKQKEPKPGDIARLTPKRISLAVIPLRPERADVIRELGARLEEQGRFSVLESDKLAVFLKDRKQRDSSLIKDLGTSFGSEVAAAVEIYPSENGKLLVTTRIFYTQTAKPVGTIMVMLDLKSRKETLADVKPYFAPDKNNESEFFAEGRSYAGERKVTAKLPFEAQLFAVGNLEGNETLHYVFSDGARVHVFQQEQAGWREEWAETASLNEEMQTINIDVADINGDGVPQIFVTAMRNEKVISYVMQFQGGSYRRIAAMPGFLRVVKYPGKGPVLIGQNYDSVTFYSGRPRQYRWSEGKYIAGQEFPLPRGVELYGFVVADMGDAQPFLVSLNSSGQLVVYSNNNAIYKSEEVFPTVTTKVTKPLPLKDAWQKDAAEQAEKFGNLPVLLHRDKAVVRGRILAMDVNGDGKDEIIVPKNGSIPYLEYININAITGITDADLVGMAWTGVRLEQKMDIKHIPGILLDVQGIKQQGSDAQCLALVYIPGWWIKKDTTQVISYTVK